MKPQWRSRWAHKMLLGGRCRSDRGNFGAHLSRHSRELVEIGHSERRQKFGETDFESANQKAQAVLGHGLNTLICIGECRRQGEGDWYADLGTTGPGKDLSGRSARVMLAYEPTWAIGVGGPTRGPQLCPGKHAPFGRL